MRFSILIPTFKRPHLLSQAIEAALAQTYANREILVIDDGSPDDTRQVAARFGQAIRYLRQENKGKSAALNLGITASAGDAIVILDDDDLFPPWTVAKHAEALARNPAADFSFGQFLRFHGDSLSIAGLYDRELVPLRDPRRLAVKLMENCFIPNPASAVRREAQLRAGRYDETMYYSQDFDMILRLARANEGAFINEPVLYQRKHVSYRGPTAEETYILDSVEKWIKYDAILLNKLDREWSLGDFRPFSAAMESPRDEASALLQKAVILFLRRVYDGAIRVFAEYRQRVRACPPGSTELRIATSLLGCRYGIADLVSGESPGGEIGREMRALKWPLSMRIAFASQIRWRIRRAVTSGDVRYVAKLARFSRETFGFAATAAVLGSRFSFGARQWKRLD
jgi:glycosyltransferase involved in cell wall biosynthesis